MQFVKTIWLFFQDEILGMKWLNTLIGNLLASLGLDLTGHIVSTRYARLPGKQKVDTHLPPALKYHNLSISTITAVL